MDTSPRPKARPKTVISGKDLERIERVVWGEANTEGTAGRDAVRGVILNRLASDRFGNTIQEVLNDEFEPVQKYASADKIPVPEDDLQRGLNEFADYIQLGEDPTDGRTFFQNSKITKSRGTQFSGPDPKVIGKHTFYRGYGDQEPVYDTDFSHNISIDYSVDNDKEPYEVAQFSAGGALSKLRSKEEKKEAATAQKMSVEETRKVAGDRDFDAAKVTATRRDLYDETNEIISTPQERKRIDSARTSRLPEMDDQENPKTAKLPDTEEVKGNGLDLLSMSHGGMASAGMMAPSGVIGYDPVSGNPIPVGSTAQNVRDDIPAALSEGEFVLPADVVTWHGLKHIMGMYNEARVGLMAMASVGQIKGVQDENGPDDGTVCGCGKTDCEYCSGMDKDDYGSADEDRGDGQDVDEPTVEVVEEEYPLSAEDSEGVEAYPTEESGQYTVGDEQVLLIFQNPK
jgi:hypothetical protein